MKHKQVGIANLKARLSEHLRTVRRGASIVILDRGQSVAKIVPIEAKENTLVIREAEKPFADFPFKRQKRGKTDSLATLLAERKERS